MQISYIQTFAWNVILKCIIDDLLHLENEGIPINVGDRVIFFKGSLLMMLGDNLGCHEVGNFVTSFNSTYFCRFCLITKNQLKSNIYKVQQLRNLHNYNICVKTAERTREHSLGICGKSLLNNLKHYHVLRGLPCCISHDLYEGIIPFDFLLMIKYFIKNRWFHIAYLNYHLQRIRLSNDSTADNVPLINLKHKKICGTASEIKKLLEVFTIAVAFRIKNADDEVWQMVLYLKKLSSLVFAPALSVGQIALLQDNIRKYMDLRIKCFKNIPLRPKHHYVSHIPLHIEDFSPLKHVCTLRAESKHSFFKTVVKHGKNFVNVTKSLSEKHQLMESIHFFDEDKVTIYQTSNNFDELIDSEIQKFNNNHSRSIKFKVTKVSFRGINYEKNMCICIGVDEYGFFEVSRITLMLVDSEKENLYFVGNKFSIVENEELGIYEFSRINTCEKVSIFPYSSLLSPDPLSEAVISSTSILVPKYEPFNPVA